MDRGSILHVRVQIKHSVPPTCLPPHAMHRFVFNFEAAAPCWRPPRPPRNTATQPLPLPGPPLSGPPLPAAPLPNTSVPGAPAPGAPLPKAPLLAASLPEAPLPNASLPGTPLPSIPLPGPPLPAAPAVAPLPSPPLNATPATLIDVKRIAGNLTKAVPAGWELLRVAYLEEGGDGVRPLALVVRNASSLVVVVRGTQTGGEWDAGEGV